MNNRIYPEVIREISEDGITEILKIKRVHYDIHHFHIVSNNYFVKQKKVNDLSYPLSPPPSPCQLKRSFNERDRPKYDPYYYILGNHNDSKKRLLLRHVINENTSSLCNVQLVCNQKQYFSRHYFIWAYDLISKNYNLDLDWVIDSNHKYIKYRIPRYWDDTIEEEIIYSNNDFHYIPIIYKSIFSALIKFKIILTRIRIKKRKKLFLLATIYQSYNNRSAFTNFGGSSNLPIRRSIIHYL